MVTESSNSSKKKVVFMLIVGLYYSVGPRMTSRQLPGSQADMTAVWGNSSGPALSLSSALTSGTFPNKLSSSRSMSSCMTYRIL
ncbi:hypothetical protein P5673_007383 [Acropora cervicornis]|uniref:Uncharacterized protein n=1 Tax=Acropora cervicornis TaxID=6130 RepID=A0AAD9QVW7_ACRCE|nr:hypothetical protein P5673_007383 [Acropora cervicornis]